MQKMANKGALIHLLTETNFGKLHYFIEQITVCSQKQAITPRTIYYFCNNKDIFKVPPFAFISHISHSLSLSEDSISLLYCFSFSHLTQFHLPSQHNLVFSVSSKHSLDRKASKETVALINEMLPIG